jgi:hypothetical protein
MGANPIPARVLGISVLCMHGNRPATPLIVFALVAASLAGCSRKKSIGRDEVKSEIRSARSFAAESEIFIDFVLRGHATRHYAEEHSAYLKDAVEQSTKEFREGAPEPDVENSVRECEIKLSMLAGEISRIQTAIGNDDVEALLASKGRIRQIREGFEKVNSQL